MDIPIRCPRCKKKYVFFGAISEVSFCPECLSKERAEYRRVREYVQDNKGCSISEVSEATNISSAKIIRYLKEERLEVIGENFFLKCESCGTPINTGRFCQACSKRGSTAVIAKPEASSDGQGKFEFK